MTLDVIEFSLVKKQVVVAIAYFGILVTKTVAKLRGVIQNLRRLTFECFDLHILKKNKWFYSFFYCEKKSNKFLVLDVFL